MQVTDNDRPLTFHSLKLGEDLGEACALLQSSGSDPGSVLLKFGRVGDVHNRLCGTPQPLTLPAGFNPKVTREQMVKAIQWALELDFVAKEEFASGIAVSKPIPLGCPPPLPTPDGNARLEDYWSLRMSVGELIRPLFLTTPEDGALFNFQHRGVDWLLDQTAGILADDMGLGKTIQAIMALRRLFNSGEARLALVICPRTLLANWEGELVSWAPELSRLRVTPRAAEREGIWDAVLGRAHVLLTNYEQVRKVPQALLPRQVDVLVADEAHGVRNLDALATRGVKLIKRHRFWALTGTPIERDPRDLATLLSILEPARFSPSDANLAPSVLRARARPYMLRRIKEEVLEDLPEVIDTKEILELLPSQWKSYRSALRERLAGDDQGVLALVNRLRTICDLDPATGESAKVERIAEIIANIVASREKAVVFSYLLEPLHLLHTKLSGAMGDGSLAMIEGAMSLAERDLALQRFRTDENVSVLLASSRVGGQGLTLTEANHVIFFNEWWNPSANAQARDRVVRIGQRRGVQVYRFRCKDSIEEILDEILATKSSTIADVIGQLVETPSTAGRELKSVLRQLKLNLVQ